MERKEYKLEVKEVNEDGTFVGYASVFGNVDLVGDVVEAGAFKQTINHSKGKVPILWQHDSRQPIGVTEEMKEDEKGLWIKARLALATQRGREAYELLKMGAIKGLSIGYDVVKQKMEGGVRKLKELRLWEISVVTFAANPEAAVLSVKSVVPFQDLPLAERDRSWDADAAVARVRAWAGGPEKENVNWSRYRRAFLWYDSSAPENFTSYKLPIADVIDGELRAVPRAIFAAAAALQGARGGVDVPAEDKARLRQHLSRYYAKMRREFDDDSIVPPWDDDEKGAGPDGLALGFLGWLELARQDVKAGRRHSERDVTLIKQIIAAAIDLLDDGDREEVLKALAGTGDAPAKGNPLPQGGAPISIDAHAVQSLLAEMKAWRDKHIVATG